MVRLDVCGFQDFTSAEQSIESDIAIAKRQVLTDDHVQGPSMTTNVIHSSNSILPSLHGKRSSEASDNINPRKAPKVTRACDRCKSRKAKCSGTNPCETCAARGESCTWDAKYSRGVAKPPLPGRVRLSSDEGRTPVRQSPTENNGNGFHIDAEEGIPPSRNSPEVESTRIRGQYYDSTSALSFVHRAYRRLSMRQTQNLSHTSSTGERQQPLESAGDWPPMEAESTSIQEQSFPTRQEATALLQFYFEHCVVTYRLLHRQSVDIWLETIVNNLQNGLPANHLVGSAKAAIVITIFAIVAFRKEQISSLNSTDGTRNFANSDKFFQAAKKLTNDETGLPRLESAQARLMQVLYLLQTARMNQAWYVFGNALQIISALGLHRKPHSIWDETPRTPGRDYINLQCRKRTFWTAYTLDKYLCVVLGRPTHYHDSDIDQEFPDRVNDDEMQAHSPTSTIGMEDCLIDGLIQHAQLAQLIGGISAEVYHIQRRPKHDIISAAQKYVQNLEEWRNNLPLHLGAIKPSSLVPEFRRQSIALKLAFAHAKMHANRPFLLGNMSYNESLKLKPNIVDCLSAARDALQIVNSMAADGSLIYSLWWMYYVAFCALSVVYIWEIQQRTQNMLVMSGIDTEALLELANQCHGHLAQKAPVNSPSRAYSIVLEELREEAKQHATHLDGTALQSTVAQRASFGDNGGAAYNQAMLPGVIMPQALPTSNNETGSTLGSNLWDGWEATDWLDFDSSAYMPLYDMDANQFIQ